MRLDPRAVPVRVLDRGQQLAGAIVVAVLVGAGGDGLERSAVVLAGALLVGGLAVGIWETLRWQRFEYAVGPDGLTVTSGVLSRRTREVPHHRVQNVDIEAGPIQRLAGVAAVRIETAGGGQTEVVLEYVARPAADDLQRAIEAQHSVETDETAAETLYAMSARELLVLGATAIDLRVFSLLAAGVSLVGPGLLQARGIGFEWLFLFGPLIGAGAIVGGGLLAGIATIARYAGFELQQVGDQYRYERGAIKRFSGSIPVEKVQTLTITERLPARWLGYASLTVETAGGAGTGSGPRSQAAVPIATQDRVWALADAIEPVGDPAVERPPARARRRYLFRYAALAALAVGIAGLLAWAVDWTGPWWLAVGLFALAPIAAHLTWTHRGVAVGEGVVLTRSGFWWRRTTIVPLDRVQTVERAATVFQRHRDLAGVTIDTAGVSSLLGRGARAIDRDREEADRLVATATEGLLEGLDERDRAAES